MKLVIDESVAAKWYVYDADMVKGFRLRLDFHAGVHELLAPDTFLTGCADTVIQAERKSIIDPGEAATVFLDLLSIGVNLHSAHPLIPRAIEIAFAVRLTVAASLYIALAEREQAQLLTANPKMFRNTRKHFSFILPFANLP